MNFISAEKTHLGYVKSGIGPRVIFAFHGFGQNHKAFSNLSLVYPPELYTVFAFDLFYHGKSRHPFKEEIRPFIWKHMIEKLMITYEIKEIDIICYSIGSIFAVCSFMLFPEKVRTITFIAPDGLKNHTIYDLATSSYGKSIFYQLMRRPYPLIKALDIFAKVNLFPKTLSRFVVLQLQDRSKRMKIYTSWVNFKPMHYDFDAFKEMCYQHMPSLTFFLGKDDFVIKTSKIKPLAKELPNASIVELKSNHHKMIFETIKSLMKD